MDSRDDVGANPFESDPSPPPRPTSVPQIPPPAVVIPPSSSVPTSNTSRDELASGATPGSLGRASGLRVQWPAELSRHASVTMRSAPEPVSPQTLQDTGAEAALHQALEAHSRNPEEPNYFPPVTTPNEFDAPSRGSTDGGVWDEKLAIVRDKMEVFVDPMETAGMPSVGTKSNEGKKAWNLVKGYTSGSAGLLRLRKNAGFKSGQGLGVTDSPGASAAASREGNVEDGDEVGQKEGGFFSNLLHQRNMNAGGEPESMGFASGSIGGSGVLSALMALQQQQQPESGAPSVATTPSSSRAPSRASSGNSSDEDDEDEERRKFTIKQREKRASKSAWAGAADVGKSVAGGVLGGAGYVVGGALGTAGYVVGGAGHALGFGHRKGLSTEVPGTPRGTNVSPLNPDSVSTSLSSTPPATTEAGILAARKKKGILGGTVAQVKKIGDRLGLELETSSTRPSAARSGAGVFGGLMLSTNNLAGVAAPAATQLAPSASRPGYHLSRYSVPEIPARRSLDASRPSSIRASRPSSIASTRPSTPDVEKPGSPAVTPFRPVAAKTKPSFSLNLHELPTLSNKFGFHKDARTGSGENSPRRESHLGEYFIGHKEVKETQEQRESREWEKEKRRRRKAKEKRKQQEVFITLHVAAILERQDFIMKMARSFMMFGAPSHRLEAQMQATARVLEINCQVIYLPGVMLCSFGDTATHTSEIKFLKQANGLDLGKLLAAYYVYYKVIHDKISVTEASIELDQLMTAPPKYKLWQNLIIGGLASALIQPSAFYGSFIDMLVSIPLGALLVLVQVLVSRNDLYSSLFEIVIACINAFLAAALASTKYFCFSAVASGSVVLILPGYIVLCGSLELANRSIISGSVRLVYAILYALFLGFGLAMGSELYTRATGLSIQGGQDFTCSNLRINAPWYMATIPPWAFFLTIPVYLLMLAMRNGQPFYRRETIVMLAFGSAGFSANYFAAQAFVNRADISSALGSFVVGFLGNMYGKFTRGSPFVVMVAGVLLQLPSGLSNGGGLLQFATQSASTTTSATDLTYSAGFTAAESLIETAIGLTVGLFVSAALVNLLGGGRRRGSNLSSF